MPALPGTPAVNPIQPIDLGGGGGQAKTGNLHTLFAGHALGDGAAALELLLQ
jgi:hypothetical protein